MEWQQHEFTISTDPQRLDIAFIHGFLSRSYWAKDIPVEVVQRSVNGSMVFGVFRQQQQVGFARVITDKATFAYLADVFIDEAFRGHGLSKWLMQIIMEHPDLQGLRRFMLATRDAHGLYHQFGFTAITSPENLMAVHKPDVYVQQQSS